MEVAAIVEATVVQSVQMHSFIYLLFDNPKFALKWVDVSIATVCQVHMPFRFIFFFYFFFCKILFNFFLSAHVILF